MLNDLLDQTDAVQAFAKTVPKTKARKLRVTFAFFILMTVSCEMVDVVTNDKFEISLLLPLLMEYFEMGYITVITLQFSYLVLCIAAIFSEMDRALDKYLESFIWAQSDVLVIVQPKVDNDFIKSKVTTIKSVVLLRWYEKTGSGKVENRLIKRLRMTKKYIQKFSTFRMPKKFQNVKKCQNTGKVLKKKKSQKRTFKWPKIARKN